jgi:hypothetical protein
MTTKSAIASNTSAHHRRSTRRDDAGMVVVSDILRPLIETARAEVVFGNIALKLDLEIERTAIELDLSRKVVQVDADVIQGKGEFSAMRGRFVTPPVGGFL